MRLARAVLVVTAVVATACGLTPSTAPPATAPTPTVTPTPGVKPAPTTAPTRSASPVARSQLRRGDSGTDVTALQDRLRSLGYWAGATDGTFGLLTEQAVVALQKAAGLVRDGVVGPHTRAALIASVRPAPRSRSGVEIDLERQLLLVVVDDRLMWAFNTSTGSGQTYVSEGRTALAITPRGHFAVYRQVDGTDISPLGILWRPKYFAGGVAIHGYGDVPAFPASHGCVRVSMEAMNFLWSSGLLPIGTSVWVY